MMASAPSLARGIATAASTPRIHRFRVSAHACQRYIERALGNTARPGIDGILHTATGAALDAGDYFDVVPKKQPPARIALLAVPRPGLVFAVVAGYKERCPTIATVLTREMVVSYLRTGRWTLAPGSPLPATGSTIFDGLLKAAMVPEVSPVPEVPEAAPAPAPTATPVLTPVVQVVEPSAPRLKLELPSNFMTPDGCEPPGPLHDDRHDRAQTAERKQWVREWFADHPDGSHLAAIAACIEHFGIGVRKDGLGRLKQEGAKLAKARVAPATTSTPAPGEAAMVQLATDLAVTDAQAGADQLDRLAQAYVRVARVCKERELVMEAARRQLEQAQAEFDAATEAAAAAHRARDEALAALAAA